jgi:PAS domain S-box-containing protein
MGRAFDRSVLLGIGLVVALLVVNAGLAYRNTRQLNEDAGWVAHAHEVRDLTASVLLTLVDAETGQRGFLVTGEDEFLQPYDAALNRLTGQMAKLKDKARDNERQQERIRKLEEMTAVRLALLKQGIDLRRKGEREAQGFLLSGKGKAQMDAIRELVAQMEQEEHDLLKDRERQSRHTYRVAITTGLLTAFSGLLTVGAFVGLLARSLSARQKSAAVLHEQRELFRTTLASIGDAVIATDTEGRVTFLNAVAQELTGWTQDEAQGLPLGQVFRVINEETRQPVENPAERALQEGRVVGLANHSLLIAKGGTETPIDDSGAPIRDDKGQVVGVVLIFRDISERKRAEEALRHREHTARFLARASADLTELTDYESTFQKVASIAVPSFADWCVVDLIDANGTPQRLAVTHSDSAKVHLAHELTRRYPPRSADPHGVPQVLRSGKAEMVEDIPDSLLTTLAHDDEHLRILRELGLNSYICVPMQSKGRMLGALTFVMAESGRRYNADDLVAADDLAQRAAIAIENAGLYRALQDADRRKDEFLATLAHELRNPLAPIRNALEIMRMEGGIGASAASVREMMERQVQQMIRLVDDLLDVSRITRGKIELRNERVEVAAVIESALETSRPLVKAAKHELAVIVPPQSLCVVGDRARLAQVLANLLNNSAKYTPEGGHIRLSVEQEGQQAVIRVRDNGMGIPAEMLPKIFEMFTQVHRNLERAQGGLGIGLTLVRRLVEMHNGTVEAHSEGMGQGSEFVVRLPVAKASASDEPQPPKGAGDKTAAPAKRRILVLDDYQDAADSLSRMLRITGMEVRTAYDGIEAVEAAAAFKPDVVLLDIGLPRLNGYEAARRIREQPWGKDMILVAVTGWGQEEDRQRSNEAGFDYHMVKPLDHAALMKLLAGTEHLT